MTEEKPDKIGRRDSHGLRKLIEYIAELKEIKTEGELKPIINEKIAELESFQIPFGQVVTNLTVAETIIQEEILDKADIFSIVPAFPDIQNYVQGHDNYALLKQQEIIMLINLIKKLIEMYQGKARDFKELEKQKRPTDEELIETARVLKREKPASWRPALIGKYHHAVPIVIIKRIISNVEKERSRKK